jgi:hypothetical protein
MVFTSIRTEKCCRKKLSTSDSPVGSWVRFFRQSIALDATAPCMFGVTTLRPMFDLDTGTKPFEPRPYRYASQLPVSLCGRGRRFLFRATQLLCTAIPAVGDCGVDACARLRAMGAQLQLTRSLPRQHRCYQHDLSIVLGRLTWMIVFAFSSFCTLDHLEPLFRTRKNYLIQNQISRFSIIRKTMFCCT